MNVKLDLERITSLFTKMVDPAAASRTTSGADGSTTRRSGGASMSGSLAASSNSTSESKPETLHMALQRTDGGSFPDSNSESEKSRKSDVSGSAFVKPLLPKPVLIPHQRATNIGISMAKLKVCVSMA